MACMGKGNAAGIQVGPIVLVKKQLLRVGCHAH